MEGVACAQGVDGGYFGYVNQTSLEAVSGMPFSGVGAVGDDHAASAAFEESGDQVVVVGQGEVVAGCNNVGCGDEVSEDGPPSSRIKDDQRTIIRPSVQPGQHGLRQSRMVSVEEHHFRRRQAVKQVSGRRGGDAQRPVCGDDGSDSCCVVNEHCRDSQGEVDRPGSRIDDGHAASFQVGSRCCRYRRRAKRRHQHGVNT
jgi:hypothetical protein